MRQVDQPERPPTLGEPIRKPAPTGPQWRQVDGAPKGIEQGPDGKLRTNVPTPKTLSQLMREAGFTRRPSWRSFPSDE